MMPKGVHLSCVRFPLVSKIFHSDSMEGLSSLRTVTELPKTFYEDPMVCLLLISHMLVIAACAATILGCPCS